jgi:hypothetical protein
METNVEKFGGFASRSGFGGTRQVAQTYNEMLAERGLTPTDEKRIKADAVLGISAALLQQRGHVNIALLLLDVKQPVIEGTDDRFEPDNLWLEVAPEHMDGFKTNVVEKIRDACQEVCQRRGYDIYFEGVREILPDVGPGWRETIRKDATGGPRPTNQARRIRSEPTRPAEDYLTFTNSGELTVYQALKLLQGTLPPDKTIGIFPLANGRIPGHTWEPDFLVTYMNRAGVLEIDGPHHNAKRALDMTRDHLLHQAGVAFVDHIPVQALSDPKELGPALTRFLQRIAEAR